MSGRDGGSEAPRPPRVAEWLLRRLVPLGTEGKSILGDAREEHRRRARTGSRAGAALHYWRFTLSVAWHFAGPGAGFATSFRQAVRALVRRPLLTGASVGTLALGIGAATTVFSVAYGVMFEPLPYPEPDRLVEVFREDANVTGLHPTAARVSGLYAVPFSLFRDWRDRSPVFSATGAFTPFAFTVRVGDRPERVLGAVASSGVFVALGTRAQLGRTLTPGDDEVGAPRVAVLSHGFWERAYGGDPSVLGRTLALNGTPNTIVGVMPEGFDFPGEGTEVWGSFDDASKQNPVREAGWLQVVARLRPGVSFERAEREMDQLAQRIIEDHPEEAGKAVALFRLRDLVVADTGNRLWMLVAAVGSVLLVVCANVAGLLLVRASDRRRELAVRLAMGSGRRRLGCQLLMESGLIALVGGGLGYGLAALALGPFLAAFPGGVPRASEITLDARVLLVSVALAAATSLLTGLLPAFVGTKTDVGDVLRSTQRSVTGGRRQRRLQDVLVGAEVTLAVALLVTAGLFIRSFSEMRDVDPGFHPDGILTAYLSLPGSYRQPVSRAGTFFDELTHRLREIPDVEAATVVTQMPYAGGYSRPPVRTESANGFEDGSAHISAAAPGYFRALGVPLTRGRVFTEDDGPGTEPVVVVNEPFVDRFWPGQDPLGRRMRINTSSDSTWYTVVGVVGAMRYQPDQPPPPEFYTSLAQSPSYWGTVVVKVRGDADEVAPLVRQAVWELDAGLPVTVRSLRSRMEASSALLGARFAGIVLAGLAAIAALLAVLGVYAVLAYAVSQSTREIGIRTALGAEKSAVLTSVLRRGLGLGGIGVALGLGLALLGGRFLEHLMFEVRPSDPLTLVTVSALVLLATLAASWLPALRAVRVPPARALRE